MAMKRCLDCVGLVNRFQPVCGAWLVHTIRNEVRQHWTYPSRTGMAPTICGRIVVHSSKEE